MRYFIQRRGKVEGWQNIAAAYYPHHAKTMLEALAAAEPLMPFQAVDESSRPITFTEYPVKVVAA